MMECEIVKGLKQHESGAAAEFVQQYGDRLVRSAYLLCGDEAGAQDLAQVAMIQAVKRIESFKGKSKLFSWVYGILLNTYRQYQREHCHTVLMAHVPSQEIAPASITRRLDMEAGTAPLARAIAEMPAIYREIVILRFFEDMDPKEIAYHTGLSINTVKTRLRRALHQIRKFLEENPDT